jgi:UDP-glucose 4-epimerase
MHCLVLGGAGFIGSNIVTALVKEGHKVRAFDRPNISLHNLWECINAVEVLAGDFYNINDISAALKGIDVVVHLACSTVPGPSNENPIYDVETNVLGTLSFLETALKEGVKKIIFASSGGTVYGIPESLPIRETHPTNPICSYGITKLTSEKYLALFNHLYDLDYTVLRLGNAYGKGQRTDNIQGAVAVFLGKTLADEIITVWGDGSVVRDYLCIDDLVAAFLKVIECKTRSRVYNIAGGHPYSLNEVLTIIRDTTGKNLQVEYASRRSLDVPINFLDISRAEKELYWRPKISLREGIGQFWNWLTSEEAQHPWGNDLPYLKRYTEDIGRSSFFMRDQGGT